jgi:hypothetical protein
MRDSFSLLDELESDLAAMADAELDRKYRRVAATAGGEQVAEAVATLPTERDREALASGLAEALERGQRSGAAVIHFEYDLSGRWAGWFFVCHDYAAPEEGDDSWAKDYAEEIRGPVLDGFASLHEAHGAFSDTPRFGVTLYLIARLAVTLRGLVATAPHPRVGVCMGYHQQDPIWRLRAPRL